MSINNIFRKLIKKKTPKTVMVSRNELRLVRLQTDAEWKNRIRRCTSVHREVLFFHSTKNKIKNKESVKTDSSLIKSRINLFVRSASYPIEQIDYLLENWEARRAALRPYFFLSFILGSRVRRPAFLRGARYSSAA